MLPIVGEYILIPSLITALRYGIFFMFSEVRGDSLSGKMFIISFRNNSCLSGFFAKQYKTPIADDEVYKSFVKSILYNIYEYINQNNNKSCVNVPYQYHQLLNQLP